MTTGLQPQTCEWQSQPGLHINHVLSTSLLSSSVFARLIARAAAAAPCRTRISQSPRPDRRAHLWHYHRPNLEWRLQPRSVVTVHHDLADDRGWLRLKYFLPRYREASAIHCLNVIQATLLAERGIFHTHIIPHGVDRRLFPVPARGRQWAGDRLRLGIVSQRYASEVKGEGLLRVLLAHLDPAHVSFTLVGRGRGRDAELCKANGFEAEHWEQVPYRLMPEIYASIDALLIPSQFEGGPASLPEALGSGIPVICMPVGMCPDLVEDGRNGIMLLGSPAADGMRIMALLDGGGRGIHALNTGAFAGAGGIPAWEDVMAQWYRLYATLLTAAA
jgi:glycosyltransferase involved in cell wall biosynthesis